MAEDYFEQARLRSEDLISNSANRVPICICIDASYSMIHDGRIAHVNSGLRSFIDSCNRDIYARDAVDLCLVVYKNNQAEVYQEFANVSAIHFKDIRPEGGSPMGQAICFAVDRIRERLTEYAESGITNYKPWLVIMSDDGSDDDITEAVQKVQRMKQDHHIKVKCIGLRRDTDYNYLKNFSPNQKIESYTALEIENFFTMLSQSASGLSSCIPGQDDSDLIGT